MKENKKNKVLEINEEKDSERHRERVIVKGYMRPDGTSYYVVIPKEIRELFGLKGGEYFLIKPDPDNGKIILKVAKFVEE
jgi:AbrB family looped-hinge helix DNA binding protein